MQGSCRSATSRLTQVYASEERGPEAQKYPTVNHKNLNDIEIGDYIILTRDISEEYKFKNLQEKAENFFRVTMARYFVLFKNMKK
jgi:hypothetical protein